MAKISPKKNLFLIISSLLCLSIFSSCVTTSQKITGDPLESLKLTAAEYWNLRMADKYEDTYKLEHKEGLPPYAEYLNKVMAIKKFTIVKYSFKNFHVEGDRGFIDIEFSFILPPVTKPFVQTIKDEWVLINGKWYHKLPK